MARSSDKNAPEVEAPDPYADYPHDADGNPLNEFGVPLATDGQPIFWPPTGESRHQYLARKFEEDKAALLAELAETANPSTEEKD